MKLPKHGFTLESIMKLQKDEFTIETLPGTVSVVYKPTGESLFLQGGDASYFFKEWARAQSKEATFCQFLKAFGWLEHFKSPEARQKHIDQKG